MHLAGDSAAAEHNTHPTGLGSRPSFPVCLRITSVCQPSRDDVDCLGLTCVVSDRLTFNVLGRAEKAMKALSMGALLPKGESVPVVVVVMAAFDLFSETRPFEKM